MGQANFWPLFRRFERAIALDPNFAMATSCSRAFNNAGDIERSRSTH